MKINFMCKTLNFCLIVCVKVNDKNILVEFLLH